MGVGRHKLCGLTEMRTLLPWTGFAIGGFAVSLQFFLTVTSRMTAGDSLFEALTFFFSFFTILINIAAFFVYAAHLFPGRFTLFASPLMRGTIAVAIAIVGLVYATVLAGIWAPEGLFWLCDTLLHYVAPLVYVAWWLFAGRGGTLVYANIPKMLAFPLVYCAYAVARGLLTGKYAYPFLDVDTLGSGKVLVNAAIVASLFLLFSIAAVAYDRRFPAPARNL